MSTKADKEIVRQCSITRSLLAEFGLQAYGYDPGVVCRDADGRTVDINGTVWHWLKPLLLELRLRRKKGQGGRP